MKTERIFLRQLKEKDAKKMLEWMHDESIMKFFIFNGKNATIDTALTFIRKAHDESKDIHRAIIGSDDLYLGTISLKDVDVNKGSAEYAICLHPNAIGNGVASKSTALILKYAFEVLNLSVVYLNVLEENQRAVQFYKKYNFEYVKETNVVFKGQNKKLLWFEKRKGSVKKINS